MGVIKSPSLELNGLETCYTCRISTMVSMPDFQSGYESSILLFCSKF